MIRKILPILLSLVAFIGGAAAGDKLGQPAEAENEPASSQLEDSAGAPRPAGEPGETGHGAAPDAAAAPAKAGHDTSPAHAPASAKGGHGSDGGTDPAATAWFKFPQQFFVPVLHDGQLDSTMILSLSAEMPGTAAETVYAHEIKLRDALLRQLLIHANTGGFDGNFTGEPQLRSLRADLVAAADSVVPEIADILIGDIARQER